MNKNKTKPKVMKEEGETKMLKPANPAMTTHSVVQLVFLYSAPLAGRLINH